MTFESWDDAMFWHGSLIGYMAGVKSACKDEDKSRLLLRMADTQARLELMESENAKLRELCEDMNKVAHMFCEAWEGSCSKEAEGMSLHAACPIGDTSELCVFGKLHDRMRELGI